MNYSIALIPTFSVGVDVMGVGARDFLVSQRATGSSLTLYILVYFGLALAFIGVQVETPFLDSFLDQVGSKKLLKNHGIKHTKLTKASSEISRMKRLATLDRTEVTEEKQANEESLYFKSKKQIEDGNERVPLLAKEEEEYSPHYSASNIYGDDDYISESDDDDVGDEERQLRGRGKC
ncbi:hypothetical protein BGZ80_006149 [Entomortierella chlamydospora]|uniref:Uncharacterized protein n=1 Tax=Entomortierella chlamydospora TaxID=101097 RepID=A0A9P6MZ20_9FUNG|nr:hypothetical protein BGZ80_006149 [Entomortierella chlamydospora]